MVEGEIGAADSDLGQWIWPEGFKLWWSQGFTVAQSPNEEIQDDSR